MMRRLVARMTAVAIGLLSLWGCGSSKHPQRTAPVMQRPAPQPAAPQNNAQTDHSHKHDDHAKKELIDRRPLVVRNADPKTVYLISYVGEPMEVEREAAVLPNDEFQVVTADSSSNSYSFTVESVQPSTLSPPLIGASQAKSTFKLPKGFVSINGVGFSADGMPLRIVCEKTESTLALVPAGTAIIGANDGPDDSKPSFKTRLDAFYMEVQEVTVENFDKFRTDSKESKKRTVAAPTNSDDPPNNPVLGVPWAQAQSYARWAGMELPTEAQFEKASRGPTGFRAPWGDGKPLWTHLTISLPGSNPTDSSPYGIVDLAGNAREWCSDIYSPNGHKDAASASSSDNWPGTKSSKTANLRVVKGDGPEWNAWNREGRELSKGYADVGFRCVLKIDK